MTLLENTLQDVGLLRGVGSNTTTIAVADSNYCTDSLDKSSERGAEWQQFGIPYCDELGNRSDSRTHNSLDR